MIASASGTTSRRDKTAIDERSRHALYLRFEEVLGQQEADTLMELLPPVGWADVTTKQDLAMTTDMLRNETAVLRSDMRAMGNELRAEFASQTRQIVLTLVPVIVAVNGIGVALAALLR